MRLYIIINYPMWLCAGHRRASVPIPSVNHKELRNRDGRGGERDGGGKEMKFTGASEDADTPMS
jgi:hypothetical protein